MTEDQTNLRTVAREPTKPDVDIDAVEEALEQLLGECETFHERVEVLNAVREAVHERSPFDEPVDCVQWVPVEDVEGNDYNPNEVATPEMELLHKSIAEDGYTQPIVSYELGDRKEIVDGFHRHLIGSNRDDIRDRLHGYLPLTVIDKGREERMASTIRHNRARGTHQIRGMSDVVAELHERGLSDDEIADQLGMERDEVLKLKQVSGLPEVFSDHEFSQSWTEYEDKHVPEEERLTNDDAS